MSPACPALSQPFPRVRLLLAALAAGHRLPDLPRAGEETVAPKVSVRGKTGFNTPREVLGTGSDWQASLWHSFWRGNGCSPLT